MLDNPRSVVEMSFNSASMAAFMIPGPGQAAGVALMAAPILMNIFFPVKENIDPENALPTNAELTAALNKLRNQISQDIFDSELKKAQSQLITLYNSIHKVWQASHEHASEGLAPKVTKGPMFLSTTISKVHEKTWLERYDRFKDPIFDNNSPIRNIKNWIELNPQYKIETLPLYCLAGSIWNLYCKFNIAWEYNKILLTYRRELDEWHKTLASFDMDKKLVKWKLVGEKKGEPKPEFPPRPVVPDALANVQQHSEFCGLITDFTPDFIRYAKPVAFDIKQKFQKRRVNISRRLDKVELRERGSGRNKKYYYYDSHTEKSSKAVGFKQVAVGRMRAKQGSLRLGLNKQLTREYGLDKISEKDVDIIIQTIGQWEDTVRANR